MSESWTISVDGRVYGPFSTQQLHSFQAEGRLAAHSLVARAGEDQFHPASEDPDLMHLFVSAPVEPQPAAVSAPVEDAAPHRFGRSEAESGERTHFVIVADMKSRSITGLEEEILNLGPAYRFMPQAWILSCDLSVNAVRQALVQKLGKLDTLFIVDTAHDKAAWFNFGPETDTRVRRMWQLGGEPRTGDSRASRRA